MTDDDSRLTRRRVLGGLITVGAASAAAGAGTFALFSDSETSSGNTVQAGTIDLTPDESSISSFSFTGIKPGGSTQSKTWNLTNDGSITGSLDVGVAVSNNDSSGSGDQTNSNEFAKAVEVDTLNYESGLISEITGTTDPSNLFDSSSADPYTSLYDLATNVSGDNDLSDLGDPGDGTDFTIGLSLHKDAGNDFQGEGVDVEFKFMLNQQDSQ